LAVETLPELPVKEIIATDSAPRAIGPYSQAVRVGNLIFASGQIPIDPATGEFVAGGIAEQTEQVLRNLTAVFEAAAVGLDQVVKTTVFLADMNDFTAMNEVYGRFFGENRPARSTVQRVRQPRQARPACPRATDAPFPTATRHLPSVRQTDSIPPRGGPFVGPAATLR